ncbi:alpha/beta hydrolase family protein [Flagellimonas amoyensis]|uniref:alpha/beta hydrolase family protein n=1 Tax=Flagellimonas amoyensis TaxID=2169401 RepID=UPI00131EDF6D|nr:acetylxylan esterase [Allomuricauda amoyensis]
MCISLFKNIFYVLTMLLFAGAMQAQEMDFSLCPPQDQPNNIQVYLAESAKKVSESFLQDVNTLDEWKAIRAQRYQELVEMLGLNDVPLTGERSPLNVKTVGSISMPGYRIDKIYYESLPNLYVPANLYIPKGIKKPAPAILYVCGHAETQKAYYQGLAHKFAKLGFVCLIIETIQWGEVRGEHWGTNMNGWFHWYSRGYNPGGVEAWNGIRGLDLLSQMPEVNPNALGITGASGGGSQSWYLAALDDRIKAAAPAAGGEELYAEICQSTIDHQCDCMRPLNTYQRDFSDIGALVAPKPFMIAAPNRDALFAIESVRDLHEDVKKVYDFYGASQNLSLIEADGGHGDRQTLRPKIFSFFIKHLMGKEVAPEKIGDIDKSEKAQLSVEELAVYTNGAPEDDRTKTIQETFFALPEPPMIKTKPELETYRAEVLDFLKEKTFRAFPENPVPLDVKWEYRTVEEAKYGMQTFSFVSEEGWRLKFTIYWNRPPEEKQSVLLVLKNPNEPFMDFGKFVSGIDPNQTVVYFEARGIGETGWAENMQWHIRRSLGWMGKTVASMRVYDVLRCIEALQSIPGFNIDRENINIAAEGEMSVVALYAALLKGDINTVLVKNPPASQNVPSQPDGRGEAIEMLNCLRITDVAQVAGLNLDTKFIGIGELPDTYTWTKEVYETLKPENFQIIKDFSEWK